MPQSVIMICEAGSVALQNQLLSIVSNEAFSIIVGKAKLFATSLFLLLRSVKLTLLTGS